MNDFIIKKLKILEETSKEYWNITSESGNFLNLLIKSTSSKNVLEVGTSNGYSAIWIAEALEKTGGHLVTIEFYEGRAKEAEQNLKDCGLWDFVTIKNGSAFEILKDIKQTNFENKDIDMVFIDANKSEYIRYFELIDPLLKPNSLLIADNVISHKDSMSDFLEKIENNSSYQLSYLPYGGGLLIGLKS
jgi:predicted O-methyltransferase YrrM